MDRRAFLRAVGLAPVAASVPSNPARAGDGAESPTGRTSDWSLRWRGEFSEDVFSSSVQLRATPETVVAAPRYPREVVGDEDYTIVAFDRETGRVREEFGGPTPGVVVTEDAFLTLTNIGDRPELVAHSRASPDEVLWNHELYVSPSGHLERDGDTVLVPAVDWLIAFDAVQRDRAWRSVHEGAVTGVVTLDGVAYATTEAGAVTATDLRDGSRRWRVDLGDAPTLRGPALGGRLVVATDGLGGVHAVTTGGEHAWSTRPEGAATPSSGPDDAGGSVGPVAVTGDRCFVAAGDRESNVTTVTAVGLGDGEVRWSHEVTRRNGAVEGPTLQPTVGRGAVWAVGPSTVVALDQATGRRRRLWTLSGTFVRDGPTAAPLVTDVGVFFADEGGVYALDPDGDCDAPTITNVDTSYDAPDHGTRPLDLELSLASECRALALVEVWADGRLLGAYDRHVPPDEGPVRISREFDHGLHYAETLTIKLRGTGGTVVAEREVSLPATPTEDSRGARERPSVVDTVSYVGSIAALLAGAYWYWDRDARGDERERDSGR